MFFCIALVACFGSVLFTILTEEETILFRIENHSLSFDHDYDDEPIVDGSFFCVGYDDVAAEGGPVFFSCKEVHRVLR